MNFSRRASLALLALVASASAAMAQPAPAVAPTDEDTAEEATPAPPASYPRPPPTYGRAPVDTAGVPVQIDQTGRTPDRPLSAYDMSYDARLRASSAASQGMLGPLDGSWRLNVEGLGDVYAFELADKDGEVQGAWRDLRRNGLTASGFIDDIQRLGSVLTLRFQTASGPAVATLSAQADGRWAGELTDGASRKPAVLRRN